MNCRIVNFLKILLMNLLATLSELCSMFANLNFLFFLQFSFITLVCTKIGYCVQVFTFKWNNLLWPETIKYPTRWKWAYKGINLFALYLRVEWINLVFNLFVNMSWMCIYYFIDAALWFRISQKVERDIKSSFFLGIILTFAISDFHMHVLMDLYSTIAVIFLLKTNNMLICPVFLYFFSCLKQNVEHPLTWLRSYLKMVESILMLLISGL